MESTSTRATKSQQKRELERATPGQIVRQAGLILIVIAVWAGLLVVFLNLTGTEEAPPVSEAPELTQASEPTEESPMAAAAATDTIAAPTESAEATSEPTVLPTEPPTVTSSPGELPDETETPASPTDTAAPPEAAGISFSEEVLPILTSRCERCHGGDRIEAGLDLLSYDGVMAGSDDGPVVIPGSSATSSLVESIVSGDMPKRAPKLPASEIETIANWVDQGALDN